MTDVPVAGSFRDPAGRVFARDGVILRRVEAAGMDALLLLHSSGLYASLTRERLLVPHEDLGPDAGQARPGTVLRPQRIPMVSYPYEWSPSQLREAALATLRAQRLALDAGMILKDASAYNVQFLEGRPILIDTLSFERYRGGPWLAYRQFCQHFYGPLLLATRRDPHLLGLSRQFIDGPPLGLVSSLLPTTSWFRPGPLFHIHLHASAERIWTAPATPPPSEASLSGGANTKTTRDVVALTESLERAIVGVSWTPRSRWAGYYAMAESYTTDAFALKSRVVADWLDRLRPDVIWDLGANTGHFSRLAATTGATVVACDADVACVDTSYRQVVREAALRRVLPLVLDLANPSPAIGWANTERQTFAARGPADLTMALALIHHLVYGNNVGLAAIAAYLATLGRRAIVEFVPATDPMVREMVRRRPPAGDEYDEAAFEQAFGAHFRIDERLALAPSERSLYLLTAR